MDEESARWGMGVFALLGCSLRMPVHHKKNKNKNKKEEEEI